MYKKYMCNESYRILVNPQIGLQNRQQSFVLAENKVSMLKKKKKCCNWFLFLFISPSSLSFLFMLIDFLSKWDTLHKIVAVVVWEGIWKYENNTGY